MRDYIDILLDKLLEHDGCYLDGNYFFQHTREKLAQEALLATLSKGQTRLFLVYEAQQNAASTLREKALTRRAFLLAKEIYR